MIRIRKQISIFLLGLLLLMALASPILGADNLPKASRDFYVYDELYLLDQTSKDYLIASNRDLHKKTEAQVVVAIVKSLNDMDINNFATKLFEKWKIGGRKDDNGILILVVPDEKELWIEVGYGLEGILPDGRVKGIINEKILPNFSNDNYSGGIVAGFQEIVKYIEKEYQVEVNSDLPEEIEKDLVDNESDRKRAKYIIGIIIFIIFIDLKFFRGFLLSSILRSSFRGYGGYGGGYGGSGRGSGRSSGGGGRSGGGGAGGRW